MGPSWVLVSRAWPALLPEARPLGSLRPQPLEDWSGSSKAGLVVVVVVVAPICATDLGIGVLSLFCGTATVWKKVFPLSQGCFKGLDVLSHAPCLLAEVLSKKPWSPIWEGALG